VFLFGLLPGALAGLLDLQRESLALGNRFRFLRSRRGRGGRGKG
jgi:hypothetical protein